MKNCVLSAAAAILVFCSGAQTACSPVPDQVPVPLAGTNREVKPTPTPLPVTTIKASGFVTDEAGIIDAGSKLRFENALSKLRKQAKIDLALAIIRTTNGEKISDYSRAVAMDWKVGSDNGGVLLMVAIDDRTWHIQIDEKLQQYLTNDDVKEIGDSMVPYFKEKKYVEGLKKCVELLILSLAEKQKFDPIKI